MFLCVYCRALLLESSSFALRWENLFVEFLVELCIVSVWTENKHYYHLLPKLIVLSLLSTTIGPEHKPLLWIGVVQPWQSKSGTQCWAYGRWTGPFSHQSHHKLLQLNCSQPVNQQQHQLAYVSHLLADPKSHAKIDFFSGNKATKCMTFPQVADRLTSDNLYSITNFVYPYNSVSKEDSAQITSWHVMVSGKMIHSIPRGKDESETIFQGRRGRIQPILRRTGHL